MEQMLLLPNNAVLTLLPHQVLRHKSRSSRHETWIQEPRRPKSPFPFSVLISEQARDIPAPTPTLPAGPEQMFQKEMLKLDFKALHDGEATVSRGQPFQWLTTSSVNICILLLVCLCHAPDGLEPCM